jgi:hypothetical protein
MWALQALLFCLLSMWAIASPGLPGESELFNNYKHSFKDKKKKKTPWLWSASELCRPSDRRFLAK